MLIYLAYTIGTIGVLVEWRAYLHPHAQGFKTYSAIGAACWSIMYLLLGAWTAAVTLALTSVRTYLSHIIQATHHKHLSAIGFTLVFMMITAITWQGMVSLLPAIAVINTTLALFYLNNQHMRIAMLISSAAWIGNDIYWQAWPALVAESVAVVINVKMILSLRNH